jgi:hypothetical protein
MGYMDRYSGTMAATTRRGGKNRQSGRQRESRQGVQRGQPQPGQGVDRGATVQRSFTSQAQLSLRSSGQVMDSSEDQYTEYEQVGRRIVDPYAARAAAEAIEASRYRTLHAGMDVRSDGPAYPAASVRGWRTTQMGTVGTMPGYDSQPWDARQQAGFLETGARPPGFAEELHRAERNRWQSGRLEQGTMTLYPSQERPYLMIRCPDTAGDGTSSVSIRLTAGSPGGAEFSREFFLGGGFTAAFLLDGYQTVKVQLLQVQNPGVDRIEWAWEVSGVQAGDQSLYLPQVLTPGGVMTVYDVPEGAFEVVWGDAPATLSWLNPVNGADFLAPGAPGVFINFPTMGSQYQLNNAAQVSVLWRLRSI